MSFELEPGERCTLKRDYMVDGRCAFTRGASVVIETIDPDRDRPGFKYVIFSARLEERVRLRGIDLQRVNCKECGTELGPDDDRCGACGWVCLEKETEAIEAATRERLKRPPRHDSSGPSIGPFG